MPHRSIRCGHERREMKILTIILEILGWLLCGFILWVIYPIVQKLITLGQKLHHLWN